MDEFKKAMIGGLIGLLFALIVGFAFLPFFV